METPMKELLDMLQVQNPLRQQMLDKEKDLILKSYSYGFTEGRMNYPENSLSYYNLLIYNI